MKKIDFLIGHNLYSTIGYFSRAFGAALRKKKVRTRLFYIGKDAFYKALYPILSDPPDITFSFSDIRQGNNPLGNLWTIPHFSYLVDPVIYYSHQFKTENSFVSCVDRKDLKIMGNRRTCFLPHAVDAKLFERPKQKEYLYDIVMLGTCFDLDKIQLSWSEKFPKRMVNLLIEAAESVLASEGLSCLEALIEHGFVEDLPLYHHELDLYIGAKERIDLVTSLKGLPIHIWGKGAWKKYFPDATIHKPVNFGACLKIFEQAKIVLNTSSRFKEGAHERIFYSLALSSLPVTQSNKFISEYFADEKSLVTYNCGQYKNLKEKLSDYLANDTKREEVVERGRVVTKKYHTWDVRAESFLKFIQDNFEDKNVFNFAKSESNSASK